MKKMHDRKEKGKAGKAKAYHHGDLPQAMLAEAVRTIQRHGIDELTLRGVGERLGVSRTALYRHFANKDALLQAVATEGFCMLQAALQDAWQRAGAGLPGFDAMGAAYIRFAVRHPAHYRVMFGSGHKPPMRMTAALPLAHWSARSRHCNAPERCEGKTHTNSRSTFGQWCMGLQCWRLMASCARQPKSKC